MNDSATPEPANRRPLTSRSSGWANALTRWLVQTSITANAISVISIFFAVIGAALLLYVQTPWALIVVALCVQLRLVCNLLDGMVAIEGKRKSPTGALYNELPDRIADSLFIVPVGYLIGEPWLGWLGALAAAVTAYIRVLGGAIGLPQDFRGPMAKPHRMAVLTAACVIGALEWWLNGSRWALLTAAWVIAIGSLITCVTRTRAMAQLLRAKVS